jgi:hypothetical protein
VKPIYIILQTNTDNISCSNSWNPPDEAAIGSHWDDPLPCTLPRQPKQAEKEEQLKSFASRNEYCEAEISSRQRRRNVGREKECIVPKETTIDGHELSENGQRPRRKAKGIERTKPDADSDLQQSAKDRRKKKYPMNRGDNRTTGKKNELGSTPIPIRANRQLTGDAAESRPGVGRREPITDHEFPFSSTSSYRMDPNPAKRANCNRDNSAALDQQVLQQRPKAIGEERKRKFEVH